MFQTLRRRNRLLPRQHPIKQRRHRIEIRIRPLQKLPAVLLDGRIARFQHDIRSILQCRYGFRRSEVDQLNDSFLRDENIVGGDVPVKHAFFMYFFQGVKYRQNDSPAPLIVLFISGLLQNVSHIHPFQILHHDIARSVLLEEIRDLHHAPHLMQSCHLSGLLQKLPQPPLIAEEQPFL